MNRLLLSIILLLLSASKPEAQPYYFRHYQVEAGLSNNTVYCSVQDKAGFLWFGTKEGLNRFDGYHFKVFRLGTEVQPALTPEPIYSLCNDTQGTVWAGSQKGLYRLDAASERMIRVADSLTYINNIQTDTTGLLWFTSAGLLYGYDSKKNTASRFAATAAMQVTSVCRMADGAMWVATADGHLKKFNTVTQSFDSYDLFAHSAPTSSRFIQKIYAAGQDSIFVGTSNQGLKLFQIPMARYTDLLTHNADKTSVFVRDVAQYAPGEYWLATESGVFIFNTATGTFTNIKKRPLDPYSLSDNAVYTLCKDREGGLWAGTYFGGVNYYPKQYTPFRKYFPDYTGNSISGNVVREIVEDGHGNLWIGTEDGGLNRLSKKNGTVTQFHPAGTPGSIAYSNIHGLLVDGDDLWIGTFEHGLDIMDIRTGTVKRHYAAGASGLKSNFVVSLLKTASGVIYIGTSNGLFRYHKAADRFSAVPLRPGASFISALLEGSDGTIWVGTHGAGVYYFNPVTDRHGLLKNIPGQVNSLSGNQINALCEDNDHNIWAATEGGGLCRLANDRKTFSRFTTAHGLPGNVVFKVLEDNNKNLWISTSKGLAQFHPATGGIKVYTKAAGLLNDQFNYNSGYKDASGNLYFGSVKGMIAFNPDAFRQARFAPPLFITGFQVAGRELEPAAGHGDLKKSVLYANEVVLPYNQSSFSIDVAALAYTAPEVTAYRYRMKGLETNPTFMNGNRKIYFTNLAPGQYTFQVAAAVNGYEYGAEKSLRIVILPPFWATAWAYTLYAAVALLLLYYIIRSYRTHLEDKKEKELYEAKLDFFTNITHEIKTPLTLIKGPLEAVSEAAAALPEIQADVHTMERATARLLSLITQILDFRKAESKRFNLNFAKLNFSRLLHDEYAAFVPLAKKRKLDCTLHLPPADVHAVADEDAVQKILSNLLSNAVKYANGKLSVRLHAVKTEGANLVVEITNDGYAIPPEMSERIFEPFYRLKDAARQKGTGIGLALARSLAELHGGRLYLKDGRNGLNTFVLLLPPAPAQTDNQQTKTHQALPEKI